MITKNDEMISDFCGDRNIIFYKTVYDHKYKKKCKKWLKREGDGCGNH